MESTLSRQSDGALAQQPAQFNQPVRLLDPRAEGGVTEYKSGENLRMWAATISAGFKEDDKPKVVRDGKIRLHEDMGDAPGIRAALKATGYTSITITLLSNDINECLKQMFCSYGKVKIFGNHEALTVMELVPNPSDPKSPGQKRTVLKAGEPGFKAALELCKPSTFVPFALAAWDEKGLPFIYWPDGFIPYRLRFGSLNSARGFVDSLQSIQNLTNGQLMGVPLSLSIGYKTVMTPQLERRRVPIWTAVLKHPKGLAMRSSDIRNVLTAGISDAQQMALPQFTVDHEEVFRHDEAIEEELMTDADIETATTGAKPATRIADYFRAVQDTPWATDEFRPVLVARMAEAAGIALESESLRDLAEHATPDEWAICTEVFCKAAAEHHGTNHIDPDAKVVVDRYGRTIEQHRSGPIAVCDAEPEDLYGDVAIEPPKTEPAPPPAGPPSAPPAPPAAPQPEPQKPTRAQIHGSFKLSKDQDDELKAKAKELGLTYSAFICNAHDAGARGFADLLRALATLKAEAEAAAIKDAEFTEEPPSESHEDAAAVTSPAETEPAALSHQHGAAAQPVEASSDYDPFADETGENEAEFLRRNAQIGRPALKEAPDEWTFIVKKLCGPEASIESLTEKQYEILAQDAIKVVAGIHEEHDSLKAWMAKPQKELM